MEYNPKVFEGEHAQEIFSEVIHRNNTVEKGLVRVLDNIKNEVTLTAVEGEIPYSEYKEDIKEADLATYTDTLKFADFTVNPKKIMALTTFGMDDLRNSRFSKDMAAGAANITSNEFEQAVLGHCIPRLGKSFERTFYNSVTQATKDAVAADAVSGYTAGEKALVASLPVGKVDGLLVQIIVSKLGVKVAGAAKTVANLQAEYNKLFTAIPSELIGSADLRIFASYADLQLIMQANAAQQYRDIFVVNGMEASYLGVKIEFVPIPSNVMFAGNAGASGSFILATDLLSDVATLEIGKVNNYGDRMFLKQVCTLDAAIAIPTQKVLYIA